ncbi:unnamed protein product [Microthlaspi erraticum]|uniref:Uncharacterized protein n=1 Tax=Microthlaspi erraticum TaxID=1685480 RepID=A0A6D2J4W9_9BRAS|nr:unnamed protein product [Microthlaspi erraticum]
MGEVDDEVKRSIKRAKQGAIKILEGGHRSHRDFARGMIRVDSIQTFSASVNNKFDGHFSRGSMGGGFYSERRTEGGGALLVELMPAIKFRKRRSSIMAAGGM